MNEFRKLAGILMIISAFTHVLQVFVYEETVSVYSAAIYGGVIYALIGIQTLKGNPIAFKAGIIFPLLGGIGGAYRALFSEDVLFPAFHVMIDCIVIPIFVYLVWFREESY